MADLEVAIRPAVEDDLPFVLNSWLRSHQESGSLAVHMRKSTYFAVHKPVILRLLECCDVFVACPACEHGTIAGYIVCEPSRRTVHWIYVKRTPYRGAGVARALLRHVGLYKDGPIRASHDSRDGRSMLRRFEIEVIPHLAWSGE